jgi:saccharopine dehydrogenase-like NADP-dependent oxidoreductase
MLMAETKRTFIVLGGAGTIGRVVARDLFESHAQNRILVADHDEEGAVRYAEQFHSQRVCGQYADCRQVAALADLLKGYCVVINCTTHHLNLAVMQAALEAGTHYLDLGGLFYWTRRQLKLDEEFRKVGLTAIIGMGCAPGITNLMTRQAIDLMEEVHLVKIRVGSRDFNSQGESFYFPYSAQTILEELTLPPWIWIGGRFRKTRPRTGWELVRFSRPVGALWVVRTRHSEVATIPLTFRKKGLRHCDFKVGFDRRFVREILKRRRAGWSVQQFSELHTPSRQPNDYEIAQVVAIGRKLETKGPMEITVDCHSRARPDWSASAGDIDTACPVSIAAQMIACGTIAVRGVFPPETAVPVALMKHELHQRGLKWVLKLRRLQPGCSQGSRK